MFTLAETGTINLNRSTCVIFGTTPFLGALVFLTGYYIIGETRIELKLNTQQLLIISSIVIAIIIAYTAYLLYAISRK